jgi:DNA-binding response OmpR family regulator
MGAKLLLADDSVTIQKVVELTLADEDYELTTVSDGATALEKAEQLHPNLILADIVMPELNGYELCERVRQNNTIANTPVILLSSTFETYDETRGKSVGANDHIIKPFESDELTRKIRSWLEKKGGVQETTKVDDFQEEEMIQSLEASVSAEPQEPPIVEEEEFDFELSDDFMEEAEEMFEEPEEETAASVQPEEILSQERPATEESMGFEDMEAKEEAFGANTKPFEAEQTQEEQIAEEISPDLVGESSAAEPLETESEDFATAEMEIPARNPEIDSELLEEEDVNVYEIPEEYAEGMESTEEDSVPSSTAFQIKDEPVDMIDEFMAAEETLASDEAAGTEQDLTEEEIFEAVGENQPKGMTTQQPERQKTEKEMEEPFPETLPMEEHPIAQADSNVTRREPLPTAAKEETEESFEDLYPTQGATTSEWSPELTSFGGQPEHVAGQTVEKPLQEQVTAAPMPAVTEETIRKIVQEMVQEKASEIIEQVAWEVIPDLAEMMIQREIQRLQQEVEHS